MRISIQFKPTKRYDLDFGYNTTLFKGVYWFTIIIVYLENNFNSLPIRTDRDIYYVTYAVMKFKFLKHYKYWFK